MRLPKAHIFLDRTKWAHAFASWAAGFAAAMDFMLHADHMRATDWILISCMTFLAPLILPAVVLPQSPGGFIVMMFVYIAAFAAVWPFAKKRLRYKPLLVTSETKTNQPITKTLLVAMSAAGLAILTQLAVCAGALASDKSIAGWQLWLTPIPALIATSAGATVCLITASGSRRHSDAFACLIVGVVLSILSLFLLYMRISGLGRYDQ